MPRAFDPRPPAALHDPNRNELLFDIGSGLDILELMLDAFEKMISDIIDWIGYKLGIDISGWIDGVTNLLINWTSVFGNLNVFDGSFNPVKFIGSIFTLIIDRAGELLGIDLSDWTDAINNVSTWWTGFFGDLNIFQSGFNPLSIIGALFNIDLIN